MRVQLITLVKYSNYNKYFVLQRATLPLSRTYISKWLLLTSCAELSRTFTSDLKKKNICNENEELKKS